MCPVWLDATASGPARLSVNEDRVGTRLAQAGIRSSNDSGHLRMHVCATKSNAKRACMVGSWLRFPRSLLHPLGALYSVYRSKHFPPLMPAVEEDRSQLEVDEEARTSWANAAFQSREALRASTANACYPMILSYSLCVPIHIHIIPSCTSIPRAR